jgi:hypothetical protein
MSINNIEIIAGAIVLILLIWIIFAEIRFRKIFRSRNPKDFEDEQLIKYLEKVETRLKKGCRGVGIVRFNPFENSGSNQSFSIAFLNEEGDGVVISSLYSREKVNIYAKPIKNSNSEYPLSEEEKEAIKSALQPNF